MGGGSAPRYCSLCPYKDKPGQISDKSTPELLLPATSTTEYKKKVKDGKTDEVCVAFVCLFNRQIYEEKSGESMWEAAALSNIWRHVPGTPGSVKALRFQDKRIPAPFLPGGQVKTCIGLQIF